MSYLQRAMQGFQRDLRNRAERIKRGAYLTSVEFSPVSVSQFDVTAHWLDKDGTKRSYTKHYAPEVVLASQGVRGFTLKKKSCRFVDEFIRDVLAIRGVL